MWTQTKKAFLGKRTVEGSYRGEPAWPVGRHGCVGRLGMTDDLELGVTPEGVIVRLGEVREGLTERPSWAYDEDMFNRIEGGISFVTKCLLRHANSQGVEIDLGLPESQ